VQLVFYFERLGRLFNHNGPLEPLPAAPHVPREQSGGKSAEQRVVTKCSQILQAFEQSLNLNAMIL